MINLQLLSQSHTSLHLFLKVQSTEFQERVQLKTEKMCGNTKRPMNIMRNYFWGSFELFRSKGTMMSKVQQTYQRSRSIRRYVLSCANANWYTSRVATFYGKDGGRPLSTINIPLLVGLQGY